MIGFDFLGIILPAQETGADEAGMHWVGSLVTGAAGWRGRGHMLFAVVVAVVSAVLLPSFLLLLLPLPCVLVVLACLVGSTER